jgi:hypothetical protein
MTSAAGPPVRVRIVTGALVPDAVLLPCVAPVAGVPPAVCASAGLDRPSAPIAITPQSVPIPNVLLHIFITAPFQLLQFLLYCLVLLIA